MIEETTIFYILIALFFIILTFEISLIIKIKKMMNEIKKLEKQSKRNTREIREQLQQLKQQYKKTNTK